MGATIRNIEAMPKLEHEGLMVAVAESKRCARALASASSDLDNIKTG